MKSCAELLENAITQAHLNKKDELNALRRLHKFHKNSIKP